MARMIAATLLVSLFGLIQVELLAGQGVEQLKPGVVKIIAQPAEGTRKAGTGFIVKLEMDAAYIMTAAHVVSGDAQPGVEFFRKNSIPVPADVLGVDEMRGLAVLVVRGQQNILSELIALPLASHSGLLGGENIIIIGFPRSAGPWHVTTGNFGSRRGSDIYFSPSLDEGSSGGPIIQNGNVIGMVAGGIQSIGQGITIGSIKDYVEGLGVTPRESSECDKEKTSEKRSACYITEAVLEHLNRRH